MSSGRMRVLLDCRMATWTGVGRYSSSLTRALAARSDLDVAVVTAAGDPPIAPGLPETLATSHPFSPAGALELGRIARAARADVVHCLHFPTPAPVFHPLVVTLHDLTPIVIEDAMPSASRRAVYRMLNRRASRVADAIITPSRATADDVSRLLPHADGKVHVVLEAADDFASGPAAPLTGRARELATAPYILSMGVTKPHKDLPTLLAAFARIAPRFPELRLLLVGHGDPAYVVARLATQPRGVRQRVGFTGRVSDGELRTLYSGAQVFAFPSTYEGFGLPPLEAMALGAPTVVSDASSLPEVVGSGALTFSAGDPSTLATALERLLGDPAEAQRVREAGLARAAELTWARAAERTVAVYREVAGR